MHSESHPLAGKVVKIKDEATDPIQHQVEGGAAYHVEDWWDFLTNGSWMDAQGNPAALQYAVRGVANGLPIDDEVVYGHIKSGNARIGHLVHVSELGEVVE